MSSPLSEYQRFVDQFVERSFSVEAWNVRKGLVNISLLPPANPQPRPSEVHAHERFVRENPEQVAFQRLLDALSAEQREVLAQMLEEARQSALHDALAIIEDEYELSRDGVALPAHPYNGTTLYQLYVARLASDSWEDLESERQYDDEGSSTS